MTVRGHSVRTRKLDPDLRGGEDAMAATSQFMGGVPSGDERSSGV